MGETMGLDREHFIISAGCIYIFFNRRIQGSAAPLLEALYKMDDHIDIDFIFNKAATVIKKHLEENSKREASVVRFMSPTDLLKVIDFSLPNDPESRDKLLEYVKKVMEYSIQAGKHTPLS